MGFWQYFDIVWAVLTVGGLIIEQRSRAGKILSSGRPVIDLTKDGKLVDNLIVRFLIIGVFWYIGMYLTAAVHFFMGVPIDVHYSRENRRKAP